MHTRPSDQHAGGVEQRQFLQQHNALAIICGTISTARHSLMQNAVHATTVRLTGLYSRAFCRNSY